MESENTTVKLQSQDGKLFDIALAAAEGSELVRNITEDDDTEVVEIGRVNSACLERIVEFMEHNKTEPMKTIESPLEGDSFDTALKQKWFRDFINEDSVTTEMLFELMEAANYMGIPSLLQLTSLKLTFMLHKKTPDEVREFFNLRKMTKEEEAKARKEHKWIFEDE
mmetsp:Transcript_17467/g.49336  ORF Transcript_17467/g.49336 Transcript_17467/m.49336 type:complete len:167 (-) Transcript_17467:248-748(-)|eukprot:CAMPEP_0119559594 /NCGR_PEP_ID=MMETSP1352-20130426/12930_1 /TAXON_ID=265584 /ORGANISM="Stauroneis constricta, Strain CCMP1120" /LENGTH=166 /DNA_ID=CAMNT_0007607343 /DNA_START=144 /DNA_END=644 /DNA_ORIENTATION=+